MSSDILIYPLVFICTSFNVGSSQEARPRSADYPNPNTNPNPKKPDPGLPDLRVSVTLGLTLTITLTLTLTLTRLVCRLVRGPLGWASRIVPQLFEVNKHGSNFIPL